MYRLLFCSCGVLFQNSYVAIIRLACGSTPRAIASAYALLLWCSGLCPCAPTSPIDGCALRSCSSQALKAHPGLRLFSACAIKDCSAHFACASFATAVIDGLFSSRSSRLSNSPRLTHSLHSCSLASHLILRYPEDPEPPDPSSKESSTTPPPPPPDPPNSLLTGS